MDLKLITPDEELERCLLEAKDAANPYRWILINIDHPKCKLRMEDHYRKQPPDPWQQEYKHFLSKLDKLKEKNRPFFLLTHIDSEVLQWLLIHMIPPKADTREKMAAASAKATLKNFFGSLLINKDLFVDNYDDLEVKKIEEQIHPDSKSLRDSISTTQELEQARQDELEVLHKIEHCNHSRSGGALNFNCLLDQNSLPELDKFQKGQYGLIRFAMSPDLSKVIHEGKILAEDLQLLRKYFDFEQENEHDQQLIPGHLEPGYILFKFKHLEPKTKQQKETLIMIAYVPTDLQLPMKMRFAYSVNQQSFVDKMNMKLGQDIERIEVDSLEEITVKRVFIDLYPELDPSMNGHHNQKEMNDPFRATSDQAQRLKFDKPTPKGRGPRRMIK